MTDRINRNTIVKVKVVIAGTAMYIQAVHQLRTSGHACDSLKSLEHIRGAQRRESPLECGCIYAFQARLGCISASVDDSRDAGFVYSIVLFFWCYIGLGMAAVRVGMKMN